jgi:hypothetical protein
MGEPDEEAHEDENDVSQSSFRIASISVGERDQRLPRERSDGFCRYGLCYIPYLSSGLIIVCLTDILCI